MNIKKQLIEQLTATISSLGITDITPDVTYSADAKHGDYASNVALVVAKKLGKNPMDLSEEIANKFKEHEMIEKVEVAKPGFINFWVRNEVLQKIFQQEIFSFPDIGKGRIVVVEYSSPNIAKPFTIGHLRSTIIGDAIANLLSATGWDVKRDNHIGDWGTQFGKQIAALKYISLKDGHVDITNNDRILEENINTIEKSDQQVKFLVDLYVKFHEEAEKNPVLEMIAREEFAELEKGTEDRPNNPYSNRALWKKCIEWSWKEFNQIYKQLGVSFTENNGRGYGESFFEKRMVFVLDELKQRKLLKQGKEGAKIVEFPEDPKLPPLMILKKDGASLYATRDLATDKFRLEKYGEDVVIINEVGTEQSLYFSQLYLLEEMLGWFEKVQRIHIKHGLYRFKDQKMSTRKGNVIWLEDVLDMAIYKANDIAMNVRSEVVGHEIKVKHDKLVSKKLRDEITQQVAIGAIKWNDLKRSPEQDILFDWDEILNMQGNSGPYAQYVYARTQSVLARGKGEGVRGKEFTLKALPLTLAPEERELLRLLSRFPEIVEEAAVRYSPNILATYLFELAHAFNLFYQKYPILKGEGDLKEFRLALTWGTGKVIKQGLELLGIQTPEKM